ncbi:41992_t:CDS:2, partial [Gigaspora margarita]
LLATEPAFVISVPCSYNETQGITMQLALTHNEVKRAKMRERRIGALVYSFYFGAQICAASGPKKAAAQRKYGGYFVRAATRIYNLFEPYGVEQIYWTQHMQIFKMAALLKQFYENLSQHGLVVQALFGGGDDRLFTISNQSCNHLLAITIP